MAMKESGEMYLETIYILTQKGNHVRGIDIGEYMGFSKPSVSRAVGLLKKDGLAETDNRGFIHLTEKGLIQAKQIYERHTVLTKLFITLGVDEETATEDACRIEHYLSDRTFEAVKERLKRYDFFD